MNDNMAILRIRKIKSQAEFHGLERHNTNRDGLKHRMHPENEHLNKIYTPKEYADCKNVYAAFKKSTKDLTRKPRKDAVLGFEAIASCSFFDGIDIKEWANEVLMFFARTWGKKNIYKFFLHLDETTPHIHCILGCVIEDERGKRLSGKSFSDGPEKMRKLQTDYAEALERFGVIRGIPKAKRREAGEVHYHRDLKTYWGFKEYEEKQKDRIK